jgi:hypothetical protein
MAVLETGAGVDVDVDCGGTWEGWRGRQTAPASRGDQPGGQSGKLDRVGEPQAAQLLARTTRLLLTPARDLRI